MKYLKYYRIWFTFLIALLLVGCGPIEQRLADGTAVAASRQGLPLAADAESGGGEQPQEDGSGGGDDLDAEDWEETLSALFASTPTSTQIPTHTQTLKPPPIPEITVTEEQDDESATPTIDTAKLTALAETLAALETGSATPASTLQTTAQPTAEETGSPEETSSSTEVPCLALRFVADVTYPPGSEVDPSSSFYKSWQVQNVGTCTWTGNFALVYDSGFQLGGQSPLPLGSGVSVQPNQYVTLTIQLWTPPQSGTYTSTWILQNENGATFGGGDNQDEPLIVRVVVPGESPPAFTSPASTAPPFFTSTPSP